MHRPHHYLASLFVTAAFAAPLSIVAAPAPQDASVQVRSTIKITRIITTGTTTRIAPGVNSSSRTTGILTNTRRRTRRSSRNTGTGVTLTPTLEIMTGTNKVARQLAFLA
jgi:hypothetical protein